MSKMWFIVVLFVYTHLTKTVHVCVCVWVFPSFNETWYRMTVEIKNLRLSALISYPVHPHGPPTLLAGCDWPLIPRWISMAQSGFPGRATVRLTTDEPFISGQNVSESSTYHTPLPPTGSHWQLSCVAAHLTHILIQPRPTFTTSTTMRDCVCDWIRH